jgi:hypothetical protein
MGAARDSKGETACRVVCTWCGDVIRRDSPKESRGMCVECYARMLSEYTRPLQQSRIAPGASER